MKICQNDHIPIVFDDFKLTKCPLCKALDEISVLQDILKESESNKNLGTVTHIEKYNNPICYPDMCPINSEEECQKCQNAFTGELK